MKAHEVKINQVYRSKQSGTQVLIAGKKKDKWLTKVLTEKPGVYNGTHTLSDLVLLKRYELI